MDKLSKTDILIIKQSQNWASRSISKLKSFSDKQYGRFLRDLLNKSFSVIVNLREIWDNFVSFKDKTANAHKALSDFASIKILFDSIKHMIMHLIVPKLLQDGVNITQYYTEKQRQEKKLKEEGNKAPVSINSIDRTEKIKSVQKIIAGILAEIIPDELSSIRNETLSRLQIIIDELKKDISEESFNTSYAKAIELGETFKNKIKESLSKKTSNELYSNLIKSAGSVEEATSYYLLSLGKYGLITTPVKETLTSIKQVIPFAGESEDIYSYKKNVVDATKELIAKAKEFTITIQKAIGNDDKLSKWTSIIDLYNEFADLYNSKIDLFVYLYEALRMKAKQDKLLKSRKKQKDDKGYELPDFSGYDWQDLPSVTKSKFKPIEKIVLG